MNHETTPPYLRDQFTTCDQLRAISNTGSVPKTVTWYWHFVCTEPNFSTWQDILQKSPFTSWYLTVISWNLVYQRIDNFFSNFNTHQFWSQKQLKTNWAHFFEHKERPQCANIWQSLAKSMQLSLIFWQHFWGQAWCCLPCHLLYTLLVHCTYQIHCDFYKSISNWIKNLGNPSNFTPCKSNGSVFSSLTPT